MVAGINSQPFILVLPRIQITNVYLFYLFTAFPCFQYMDRRPLESYPSWSCCEVHQRTKSLTKCKWNRPDLLWWTVWFAGN